MVELEPVPELELELELESKVLKSKSRSGTRPYFTYSCSAVEQHNIYSAPAVPAPAPIIIYGRNNKISHKIIFSFCFIRFRSS
jgi:hypothetical protein